METETEKTNTHDHIDNHDKSKTELLKELGIQEDSEINLVTEGKAKILVRTYKATKNNELQEQEVFYNPVQIFNRDLTVFIIKTYAEKLAKEQGEKFKGIRILDALAASALRTIRFAKEIKPELIQCINANDISASAIKIIKKNFEINKLDLYRVTVTQDDANNLMYRSKDNLWTKDPPLKYDVIDLDPYGSVVPFLDTAMQAIKDGGLMCCTCTDLRVLSGPDIAKCFYYYGACRARMDMHQENALRIVLYTISSTANKYSKFIKPLFSYQSEFYLRVFFTVHISKADCSKSMTKYGNVYYCTTCDNFHVHTLGKMEVKEKSTKFSLNKVNLDLSKCNQCGGSYVMNGPVWIDELNDVEFVQNLHDQMQNPSFDLDLQSKKKIYGMIYGILDEKETRKYPYGVSFSRLGRFLKTTNPNANLIKSITKAHGYTIKPSYIFPAQWKSNAPIEFFFDMVKAWRIIQKQKNNVDVFAGLAPGTGPYVCMQKPLKYTFEFSGIKIEKEAKVPKFLPNPEKNWGPKKRATMKRTLKGEEKPEEAKKDQLVKGVEGTKGEDAQGEDVQDEGEDAQDEGEDIQDEGEDLEGEGEDPKGKGEGPAHSRGEAKDQESILTDDDIEGKLQKRMKTE